MNEGDRYTACETAVLLDHPPPGPTRVPDGRLAQRAFLIAIKRATRIFQPNSAPSRRGKAHLRIAVGAMGFLPVLLLTWYFWSGHQGLPFDAQTYLAAGERLNAGHSLYGLLGAGDRTVKDASHFAAPLLSPPLVAVLWRPLAALGEWTAYAWWAAAIVSLLGTLVLLWMRAPLATGLLVALLSNYLAVEIGVANLDSFMITGLVATWWLWRRDHVAAAMWLAVLLAGLKLVPAFLVLWLLAVAPRTAWRPFLVAFAVFAGSSILGAGFGAHLDYLRVISTTADGRQGTPFIATIFAVGVLLARGRPAVAYSLVPLAMVAVWNPLAPLVALVAPVAWAAPNGSRSGDIAPPRPPDASVLSAARGRRVGHLGTD
jgi:Glycosyltransferase family 87